MTLTGHYVQLQRGRAIRTSALSLYFVIDSCERGATCNYSALVQRKEED